MTNLDDAHRAYIAAVKALNAAAYAALWTARDTDELPMVNRQILREMCHKTDALVDAGLETAGVK